MCFSHGGIRVGSKETGEVWGKVQMKAVLRLEENVGSALDPHEPVRTL